MSSQTENGKEQFLTGVDNGMGQLKEGISTQTKDVNRLKEGAVGLGAGEVKMWIGCPGIV